MASFNAAIPGNLRLAFGRHGEWEQRGPRNENSHLKGPCPCPTGKSVEINDTKPSFSKESSIPYDFSPILRNEALSIRRMR